MAALALLWQVFAIDEGHGIPELFFDDLWAVGLWRADHGGDEIGLGS